MKNIKEPYTKRMSYKGSAWIMVDRYCISFIFKYQKDTYLTEV